MTSDTESSRFPAHFQQPFTYLCQQTFRACRKLNHILKHEDAMMQDSIYNTMWVCEKLCRLS